MEVAAMEVEKAEVARVAAVKVAAVTVVVAKVEVRSVAVTVEEATVEEVAPAAETVETAAADTLEEAASEVAATAAVVECSSPAPPRWMLGSRNQRAPRKPHAHCTLLAFASKMADITQKEGGRAEGRHDTCHTEHDVMRGCEPAVSHMYSTVHDESRLEN